MMERLNSQHEMFKTVFGRLLRQKLERAALSLTELAAMTRLSADYLEDLANGVAPSPNFDVCYKIAQAINSRSQQGFVVQDLWEAATLDKLSKASRELDNRILRVNGTVRLEPKAA